jgi:D-glycero-D-manno-heptose 1,7-bisphosphate phosphatase
VVITNQSGVGRGYFDWGDYQMVENGLLDLLARNGAFVDALFANSGVAGAPETHCWRKPQPGMLLAASDVLNIDLARSVVVGDKASDLEAGRAAGLPLGIQVATGYGGSEAAAAERLATPGFRVVHIDSIAQVSAAAAPIWISGQR